MPPTRPDLADRVDAIRADLEALRGDVAAAGLPLGRQREAADSLALAERTLFDARCALLDDPDPTT